MEGNEGVTGQTGRVGDAAGRSAASGSGIPADRVPAIRASSEEGRRFLALDSLRGVAALAVVFFHVEGALDRAPQPWMPGFLGTLFHAGHFGVDVFFVLSGFVIAFSVRNGSWTPGFLGRFALKRSLRLDPPYWTAIALETAVIALGLVLFPQLGTPLPSVPQLVAHLFYLQDILGYGDIMPNFWTLCYEFQFYLVLVGTLVLGRALGRRLGARAGSWTVIAIFGALFIASVAVHNGWISGIHRGLALDRWFEFFTGALAWWVVAGVVRMPLLAAAWLTSIGVATRPDMPIESTLVVAVSVICMLSATRPKFDRMFAWGPLQFLGAISYSLYLYHPTVGWRVVSLAQRYLGATLPPAWGVLTWLAAVGAAIATSVLMWRLVERPSQSLARRVKLPRRQRAEPVDASFSALGLPSQQSALP